MALGPLVFLLFWFWVVVLGLKGVARRATQLGRWLCTPWGESDRLLPSPRGTIGQSWSSDEYRHYSALTDRTKVPEIPDLTRDMQDALDRARHTAEQLGRDIVEWQRGIDELKVAAEQWTEKAALALSNGRNDLGRAAIAERQHAKQRAVELEKELAEMRRLLTLHSSDIQSLENKLSEIYRRNHLAETRIQAAETSARARELLYGEQVKDALSRFEGLERSADLAEGHAESLAIGSRDTARLEAEIAALRQPSGFGRKGTAS
jgi:phage shock protein A